MTPQSDTRGPGPDFGHHGQAGPGWSLDAWGDGPMVMRYAGRIWRFEFSDMFGPTLLTQSNEVAKLQPIASDHPFWEPFDRWMKAGRKCRPVRTEKGRRLVYWICHVPRGETLR